MCVRFEQVKRRIVRAAERVGRRPSEIRLVAVSKTKPPEMVRDLYACGQNIFGENYVQEGVEKIKALSDIREGLSWHFIGHLQRNKAKAAVEYFDCIETIDSVRLAEAVDRQAEKMGKVMDVLIQVNIGRDRAKSGIEPDEARVFLEEIKGLSALNIRGLMTIHPWSLKSEDARMWFRALRELRDELLSTGIGVDLPELSMGMSGDFEEAVEEGATIIRVGTALFGPRAQVGSE